MDKELLVKQEEVLRAMMDVDCPPVLPTLDMNPEASTKIPLANLTALGIAFQPLTAAIQTAVSGAGGSGIYFVNTMGKKMFTTSGGREFIGSLQTAAGTVGGG